MKRFSFSAICVLALIALCGCSKKESTAGSRTTSSQSSVESVLQQRMAEVDATSAQSGSAPLSLADASSIAPDTTNKAPDATPLTPATATNNIAPVAANSDSAPAHKTPEPIKSESVSVDVDLTALSSTMVYSEVLNIMTAPETYIGKTLKMKGYFGYYHDEKTDKYYFACMIPDATACCAQGIEFILTDDYLFPDDYPQEGEIVTVAGEFITYEEDGSTYFTLRHSKLLV